MPCESSCQHAVLRPLSCVKHREKQAIGRCYKQHRVALPLAFILRNVFSGTFSATRFQRNVFSGTVVSGTVVSGTFSEERFQRDVFSGKSSATSSRLPVLGNKFSATSRPQPVLGNQLSATSRPQPVLGCQFSAPSMPSPAILASRMRQSAFLRSLGKRLSTPPPLGGRSSPALARNPVRASGSFGRTINAG